MACRWFIHGVTGERDALVVKEGDPMAPSTPPLRNDQTKSPRIATGTGSAGPVGTSRSSSAKLMRRRGDVGKRYVGRAAVASAPCPACPCRRCGIGAAVAAESDNERGAWSSTTDYQG